MEDFLRGLRDRLFPGRKKSELEEKWPVQYCEPPRPTAPPHLPSSPPARQRQADGYPPSFEATKVEGGGATQPKVFEPAYCSYTRAFRMGDPVFEDPGLAERWYAAREAALGHVVRVVSESAAGEHLVLRGSLLLKLWLGEAARPPGDVDWVVIPHTLAMVEPAGKVLTDAVLQALAREADASTFRLIVDEIVVDEIWTYDRAPGKRMVVPWEVPGLPRGNVRMDLVFGEELVQEPVPISMATGGGRNIIVSASTEEQSLAWKLGWLIADPHPQGKDLYDATLLAEQTVPPLELLYEVMEALEYGPTEPLAPDFPRDLYVDWENFQSEYPWVTGTVEEWKDRLTAALAPMFAAVDAGDE